MRDAEYDYGLEPGERFEPDEELDEPFDLNRPHVMTALGLVDQGALGFTLPQEYVISRPPGGALDLQLDDVAKAVGELEGYALTGGRALVDLTTADYGRNVGDILWVAQRVPVHIVLATGVHGHRSADPSLEVAPIDKIADQMVRELTDGIGGTDVRAGVIVAGAGSNDPSPAEAHGLRAAARAHQATGAPVSLLARNGRLALWQLGVLTEEGVDPARVTAGGFDVMQDESSAQRLLHAGAFVCIQDWGRSSDDVLAATVKRLVDAGYGEQLLISGGFARQSQWLAYGGGPGFVHFIDQVPLTLMDAGLEASTVRQIFVENSARALTTVRPKSS